MTFKNVSGLTRVKLVQNVTKLKYIYTKKLSNLYCIFLSYVRSYFQQIIAKELIYI